MKYTMEPDLPISTEQKLEALAQYLGHPPLRVLYKILEDPEVMAAVDRLVDGAVERQLVIYRNKGVKKIDWSKIDCKNGGAQNGEAISAFAACYR